MGPKVEECNAKVRSFRRQGTLLAQKLINHSKAYLILNNMIFIIICT